MNKLIPAVAAQSAPTFPYEGPFEPEPEPPTPTGDEANIRLNAGTSSLQVGEQVTCDINVESNDANIKSYTIEISYDSSILEVIDNDYTQTGIQVDFLDNAAVATVNDADNSLGTITLQATVSGSSQTINKRVAQITFRAKQSGASVVSINKTQSSVIDENDEDILGTTTSLNFTVSGQTQENGNGQLPPSGLFDNIATIGSLVSGILMLYIGIKAVVDRKRKKRNDI